MIKKFLLSFLVSIIFIHTINAQEIIPDKRIIDVFGQEKVTQLLKDDPCY